MEILYWDRDTVACIKPIGLDSERDVPRALIAELGGEIYPIHRLDQNVAGVMIFARTQKAAAILSQAVQNGSLIKEYAATVHGTPPECGDWEDLLFKDSRKNKVFVVSKERKGVKKARLLYRVISPGDKSLVHIRLCTGRSHQIRVQFSSRGYPLVGDHKYGSRDPIQSPMLFSCRIQFPWQGEIREYQAFPTWASSEDFVHF